MKSKLMIFLAIVTLAAAAAFGQTVPAKPAEPAKPAAPAKLPTAQEILAKYIKAIGGRDAVEKVKSWTSKGTVELAPMGVKGTVESISSEPNLSLVKMNLAGIGDFTEGFDGTTAWSVNPIQGAREKSGEELLQTKLNSNFHREINLDKLYKKLEVTGMEKVNGRDAYVVRAEAEGVPASTMYFDAATGFILRTDNTAVSPEGRQPVSTYFDEMQAFDGVMTPTKIRTKLPTAEITMTITEMKSGPAVEAAKFARPK